VIGLARRRAQLQARREQLRLRSAELRIGIGRDAQVLAGPLALADQVRAGARWVREHPALPVGVLVALAVLRPRRALRWGSRVWRGWRLWRRAARALRLVQRFAGPPG
jgi:hypothetical protein